MGRELRVWPTTICTPDDWLADLRFADGGTFRMGISPHLDEEQAKAKAEEIVRWAGRGRVIVDLTLRRRRFAYNSVSEMPREIQERLIQ